jgi:uncharacterized damage-inducible protein DinB
MEVIMSDQPAVSKDQLLTALRETGEDVVSKLKALPADALEAGCYENGWNGRQVLAHITAIEWTYPKLIDLARTGPQEKKPEDKPVHKAARGGIDSYNDRSIERYADTSVAELIETFRENRETTISTVEKTEDEILATEVKSAGGIRGPVATVLNLVAVMHVRQHLNDILQAAEAKA